MRRNKNMLKKVFALIFAMAFTFTVIGNADSAYAADTTGNNNNNENATADVADDDDDDMDWGWIGLLGLAGLMGLKRRDDRKD
jgi:hypothetical protein